MENFLKQYFSKEVIKKEPLPGDGGHRLYFRIQNERGQSFILMSSGKNDPSLTRFISIHKKLKDKKCLVPEILQTDSVTGFILMQDLGNTQLETIHQEEGFKKTRSYYLSTIDQLIQLQSIQASSEDPIFDGEFFKEEVCTFLNRFLNFLITLKGEGEYLANESSGLKEEMNSIISQFTSTPFLYCHRDFHSRNMMIKQDQLYLLDFQDAGQGPWMYDLTSLIYDSYVQFKDADRKELLEIYLQKSDSSVRKIIPHFSDLKFFVDLLFLQRGLKACGCFAWFYSHNQKSTHLKYIPATLDKLLNVATQLGFNQTKTYVQALIRELQTEDFYK